MRVAVLSTFANSRKEPLGETLSRLHQAFLDSGLGEPTIHFSFGDPPIARGASIVDRVLKRHPSLERFLTSASLVSGINGVRRLSNERSAASDGAVPFAILQAIAEGVPRSFPFHSVVFHLHAPAFGELASTARYSPESVPGVLLRDSWWVNGRNRSLSACTLVDADAGGKKLPELPAAVSALFKLCGKVQRTVQMPLLSLPPDAPPTLVPGVRMPHGSIIASAKPEAARAVQAITADYRARLPEIVERAALPHLLPNPGAEAYQDAGPDVTAGPKKPALERAFRPLGYVCNGRSGSFTLRRRTAANLTVELHLDVGSWGSSVLAMFRVWGLGFKALLSVPVSANALPRAQYPIGDADRWQKIAGNLAALVAELDRTLVPEIEQAVGPSPEWYQPEA